MLPGGDVAEVDLAAGELGVAKVDQGAGELGTGEADLTAEELGFAEPDNPAGEVGIAEANRAAGELGERRESELDRFGAAALMGFRVSITVQGCTDRSIFR